jgi:hypothetical protein
VRLWRKLKKELKNKGAEKKEKEGIKKKKKKKNW